MISTSLTTIITKPAAAKGPFQRSVWGYTLVRMSMMPDVIVLNPDLVAHLKYQKIKLPSVLRWDCF